MFSIEQLLKSHQYLPMPFFYFAVTSWIVNSSHNLNSVEIKAESLRQLEHKIGEKCVALRGPVREADFSIFDPFVEFVCV